MNTDTPTFGTDEILWYDNGRWGEVGYAVANPAGKIWTNNSVIYGFHSLVGRNMFELMHRADVRFYRPPHKQFWFDLHQLIVTARKRLADRQRMPNDSNGLVVEHATPVPQVFLAWPIPFFGERVRQPDIREYAQLAMLEHDRPIWAVAVPIAIRYEGDAVPGASVQGFAFADHRPSAASA